MKKLTFSAAILCTVFIHEVFGYPYNDVSIACDSMLPDRGSGPQRSTPPYVISVSFSRYDPGNEIKVVLEGTSPSGFKAFMVQARELDGNVPVGMFRIVDPNTQGLSCANTSNSAVGHRNSGVKHRVTTTWVAPQGTRKVRLMATFVQDYYTYWVGVHSKTLSPRYSELANVSHIVNDSVATNTSDAANVTSMVSEITNDSEEFSDDHEEIDFNTLVPEAEADDSSETPLDSEATDNSRRKNAVGKSRRKSVVTFDINCGKSGAYQSSSGDCVKSTQGSSQSSGSQSKIIVVKQGISSGSGCVGGKVASVYNQYGCGDTAGISDGSSSYGQSVSTNTGKEKVMTYPPSNPFPPERNTVSSKYANSKYNGVIYSQDSKPSKSGSSETIRITVQGGQGSPICDKGSSSYNIQACNQLGQSSSSQSTTSFGTQGSKSQSGSSETIRITVQGQPSGSQSGISSGTQGQASGSQSGTSSGTQSGTYTSSSSPCGQGKTYDSNPCNQGQSSSSSSSSYSSQSSYNQASSQYQGNSNPCNQGQGYSSQSTYNNQGTSSYNNNRC